MRARRPQGSTREGHALPYVALAILLSGCAAAGPDYKRPALNLPVELTTPAREIASPARPSVDTSTPTPARAGMAADSLPAPVAVPGQTLAQGVDVPEQWWTRFASPALTTLVERSLRENPGITAGQAALRQAEASVRAQQGATAPQISANYTFTRQKTPAALASPLASAAYLFNLHTLQLNLDYNPDVFGANRRAVEGLQAGVESQQALLAATQLGLASNVALTAIQEAALRAQLASLREVIALQGEALKKTRRLRTLGQLADTDVAIQESAFAGFETQLPPLEKQLGQSRSLLKVLLGDYPENVLGEQFELEQIHLPSELPLTLPSSLLERRPDIRAAEAQLKAASAAVGVAAAARLPAINLGVNSYGQSGTQLADLFRSAGNFWALAGGLTQPLFDGGTLKERELAARAGYDQAAAQYRQTVLAAFQNVADVLVAIQTDQDAAQANLHAEQAARTSFDIARRQFALGDLSALNLVQIEQTWWQARSQRQLVEAARLADSVALYQALGGASWDAPAANVPAAQ